MDCPQDDNAKCKKHLRGCGRVVNLGTCWRVDGNKCELLGGRIWQISVQMFERNGEMPCKIGVTCVLWYNLQLVCNRIGVLVSNGIGVLTNRSVCKDDQTELPMTTTLGSHCHGSATWNSSTVLFKNTSVQESSSSFSMNVLGFLLC